MKPRVGMALINRAWTAVAGLAIVAAAPTFLRPEELGTYYTFNSLLALQIFFDLGFNYVVLQVAAGEAARIEYDRAGRMLPGTARDRAVSLIQLLRRWYGVAALLFFAATVSSGLYFFGTAKTVTLGWRGPWVAVTFIATANMFNSPFLSIDEAFGHVHEVARLRLLCGIVGTVLFVCGLMLGLRLWAVPLYLLPLAVGTLVWLRSSASVLPKLRMSSLSAYALRINWRREIFPFQWRLSLSWISGYFIYQMIIPIIYRASGPVEAARFGLALAICNGLMGFGVAWLNATSPSLIHAIENQQYERLNLLFGETFKKSTWALGVAFACVLALPYVCQIVWLQLASKLPSPIVLFLLASAMLANHVIYAMATYLRSFRVEVLTAASMTSAAVTALGILIAASIEPALIPAAYSLSICCLLLPWTTSLYQKKRRQLAGAAAP